MDVVLGVDIGGSHITAALVDLEKRAIVSGSNKRKLVNSQQSAGVIIQNWSEVIKDVYGTLCRTSIRIGIAMPGPFDYFEGVSLINEQEKFKALYKLNVKNSLAKNLNVPCENISFMNDAACFLQGEIFCGAANGFNSVLGLTLGSGLGSAICNNEIVKDADLWKSKFRDGIAEDYLSTKWFVKRYKELSGKSIVGVKELTEIEEGSSIIKKIFSEFGENLGLFLMPYIKMEKSEAIIFGGNISNAFNHFYSALKSILDVNSVNTILRKALLNEDATLIGAASYWKIFNRKLIKVPHSV